MISPYKIKYNNMFSNELNMIDLIMDVAFDSDNGETASFLNRSAVQSESHDGRYKNTVRYKYDEVFEPRFTFLKKNFGDFSMDEVRKVLKYLTSTDTTSLLEVYYDDTNAVSWAAIGGWTEISTYKLANNRTVGIVATFSSIHPFALSDLYTVTKDVTKEINTTMYYWTSTLVSGSSIPQYVLTPVQTPIVGTQVYSVPSVISGSIITTPMTLYGTISKVNNDGSYVVNSTTFKLTTQGTKIYRTYDNKITINIDTDDNQPVYPRITIKHHGSVINVANALTSTSDMVYDTVYYDGTHYYWKPTSEQYAFKKSTTNPNLSTTSVRLTNTHTDFFNVTKTLEPTVVKNNNTTERIILDGANRIISSNSVNRIFGDDFVEWRWLALHDGKNEITVEGNCTVTFEYRTVIKCGEW